MSAATITHPRSRLGTVSEEIAVPIFGEKDESEREQKDWRKPDAAEDDGFKAGVRYCWKAFEVQWSQLPGRAKSSESFRALRVQLRQRCIRALVGSGRPVEETAELQRDLDNGPHESRAHRQAQLAEAKRREEEARKQKVKTALATVLEVAAGDDALTTIVRERLAKLGE